MNNLDKTLETSKTPEQESPSRRELKEDIDLLLKSGAEKNKFQEYLKNKNLPAPQRTYFWEYFRLNSKGYFEGKQETRTSFPEQFPPNSNDSRLFWIAAATVAGMTAIPVIYAILNKS